MLDLDRKKQYLKWYRIAEKVLSDLLPPLTDDQILELISREDWFIFPLQYEADRRQAINRPLPHIDMTLRKEGKIRIGIRCNTVKSVENLKNILHDIHHREREELLQRLSSLGDDFQTLVLDKQKEYNFAQTPKHECMYSVQSNKVNEEKIQELFNTVEQIRDKGRRRMKEEELKHLPEAPVIDLVVIIIPLNEETFGQKLLVIRSIFEICAQIKTKAEIKRELKKLPKEMELVGFRCERCNVEYPVQNERKRFCEKCGMRVKRICKSKIQFN